MKKSLLIVTVAALAASCTSERKDPPAGTQTKFEAVEDNSAQISAMIREDEKIPKERVTYTIQGAPGCMAHTRVAMSAEQLCTNLQYPEQNGNCGYIERTEKFQELCSSRYSWNSAPPALDQLAPFSARCELGYSDTTEADLESGKGYKMAQTIYDSRMELRHTYFIAKIVMRDESDGRKTLAAKILWDGKEVATKRMTWKNGGELPEFRLDGPNKESLICTPYFRDPPVVTPVPEPAPTPEPAPVPGPVI